MSEEKSKTKEESKKEEVKEEVKKEENGMNWTLVFIIGLGFFTTAITWGLYNSYVPIFLDEIIITHNRWFKLLYPWENTFIGIVMVLDNIAAITLQPYIGARSDKTWTKYGRRMPYLLIGIPLAAFFFIFIPVIKDLILLLFIITLFNISMALYRAPTVALMPDMVPSKHRSKANGVINFMGGVGAIYAYIIGALIYKTQGPVAAFLYTSILMLIALLIMYVYIKEPEVPLSPEEEEKMGIINAFKEVIFDEDKSGIYMLLAIMFWFFGFNIVETWFTIYGKYVVGVGEADAAMALAGFIIFFVLFSIPAGFIANKIGRRKTIIIGLIGLIIIMFLATPVRNLLYLALLLTIGGMFWAFININSIVIVWEIGGEKKLGAYTGLYYFFSMLAAIVSPPLAGLIFDLVGREIMFPLVTTYMIIALVFMLGVKKGEYSGGH